MRLGLFVIAELSSDTYQKFFNGIALVQPGRDRLLFENLGSEERAVGNIFRFLPLTLEKSRNYSLTVTVLTSVYC